LSTFRSPIADIAKFLKDYDSLYKGASPVMKQFLRIKKQYPDCIVLYRMGDFYELFFEDAIVSSDIMDISLTERGKIGDDIKIPMCGIPYHVYENYVFKLVKSGYRVVICEQVDKSYKDKNTKNYKKLLHREVVRILTPGTLTEDTFLNSRENSFLMSVFKTRSKKDNLYLSYLDISTGSFFLEKTDSIGLSSSLSRFSPKEVLLPERLFKDHNFIRLIQIWTNTIVSLPEKKFNDEIAKSLVKEAYDVNFIDIIGSFCKNSWISAGAILGYVKDTQKGSLPYLSIPRDLNKNNFLSIDAATRTNLEIDKSLSGTREGSLLSAIDNTLTGFGSRGLNYDLNFPLTNIQELQERLDFVSIAAGNIDFVDKSRFYLKMIADIERSISRLSLSRGGPRDLGTVKDTIQYASLLKDIIEEHKIKSTLCDKCVDFLHGYDDIFTVLSSALSGHLPFLVKSGGFVSDGYSRELDVSVNLRDNKRLLLKKLQLIYIRITNVNSLKIKRNSVLGYYIEVTNQYKDKLVSLNFFSRQNLTKNSRFKTYELMSLEVSLDKITNDISDQERKIFRDLVSFVLTYARELSSLSQSIARIDITLSHAFLALTENYICPIVDNSDILHIEQGRHPIVHSALEKQGKSFVSNSCYLKKNSNLWLITGPNMAGKSTFLRQNALIVILAQIGSFVPAKRAHIGVCDYLFSRIGASDNLAQGLSTFMMEMVETSAILKQATKKSLVIIDEVGRGTSTYDGLSIAFSVLEEFYSVIKCRVLFSTHYHELKYLARKLANISSHSFKVDKSNGSISFLYELTEGYSESSYGINVARLAGLPDSILHRSENLLKTLENNCRVNNLCNSLNKKQSNDFYDTLLLIGSEIKDLPVNDITPKEALNILFSLKDKFSDY
jgi:DNA mismatch repair protein MutS